MLKSGGAKTKPSDSPMTPSPNSRTPSPRPGRVSSVLNLMSNMGPELAEQLEWRLAVLKNFYTYVIRRGEENLRHALGEVEDYLLETSKLEEAA